MPEGKDDQFDSPQRKRLLILDKFLRRSGGATREQISNAVLADNMGHSGTAGYTYDRSTFTRDLDALIDRGAAIKREWLPAHDSGRTEYFYELSDPTWTMGKVKLKAEDLMAIVVTRDLVEKHWGHPIAEELTRIIDQLGKDMPNIVSVQTDQMAPIAFGPESRQVNKASTLIWKSILRATTERRKLEILYAPGWGPSAGDRPRPKTHVIHPYHIVNLSATWYLLGSKSEKDPKVRQYHIDRILNAKVLGATFTVPPDFDVQKLLDIAFGRFIGDPDDVTEVRLRFSKQVTPLVLGREFQPSTMAKRLPDGRAELTLRVSRAGEWPLYHIVGWVLSWGSDVEVLAPQELKDRVAEQVRKLADKYRGEDKRTLNLEGQ